MKRKRISFLTVLIVVAVLAFSASSFFAYTVWVRARDRLFYLQSQLVQSQAELRELIGYAQIDVPAEFALTSEDIKKAVNTFVALGGRGIYTPMPQGGLYLISFDVRFQKMSPASLAWLIQEMRKHYIYPDSGNIQVSSMTGEQCLLDPPVPAVLKMSFLSGYKFPLRLNVTVPDACRSGDVSAKFVAVSTVKSMFGGADTIYARVLKFTVNQPSMEEVTKGAEAGYMWHPLTVKLPEGTVIDGYALLQIIWKGSYKDASKVLIHCGNDTIIRITSSGITQVCPEQP